jgi:hypothetical protein
MPRKGEDDPRDRRRNLDRGGQAGEDNDAGIQNLFIVENIIQCQDFPLTC